MKQNQSICVVVSANRAAQEAEALAARGFRCEVIRTAKNVIFIGVKNG